MRRSVIRSYTLIAVALLATASGDSQSEELVSYEGTTLVVRGAQYKRPAGIYECEAPSSQNAMCTAASPRPSYAPGIIVIYLNKVDEKAVTDVLAAYGLSIINRSELRATSSLPALTRLRVAVPTLSEEQWVEAFRKEPLATGAATEQYAYLL